MNPDSKILDEFGERLRAARIEAGLSQEDLAHQAGLHRTYVGSVERGERNISLLNMVVLSDALEIDLATLLSGLSSLPRNK